jgi:hypothetical protein
MHAAQQLGLEVLVMDEGDKAPRPSAPFFRVELEIDNAAFCPQWGAEVARILRELADTVEPIGFRADSGNLTRGQRQLRRKVGGRAVMIVRRRPLTLKAETANATPLRVCLLSARLTNVAALTEALGAIRAPFNSEEKQ